MENDPELRAYYNRHHNYDSELGWGNPHVKEDEYVRKLFTKRKTKSKKNVGKKVYWD